MKTIILLTLLMFTVGSFSQAVLPQGSATSVVRYRGGVMADSVVFLPIRNTSHPSGYSNTTAKGTLLFDKNHSLLKYGNGVQFVPLLTSPRAAALYFPTPTGAAPQYLNGLGAPTSFPDWVLSEREIAIDFNGSPETQNLTADRTFTLVEGDASTTNEGGLTVGAGSAGTSEIESNTFGSSPVVLSAGSGIDINESGDTIILSSPDQTVTLSGDITGTGTTSISTSLANGSVTDAKISAVAPSKITQAGAVSGQVLKWNGSAWIAASDAVGGGTVTSAGVSTSTLSVSGSPVNTSGTMTVDLPTVVSTGNYGVVTVDQFGRVTAGKRQETYSGTTAGSGTYSVTFATSYSTTPAILVTCTNCTDTQRVRPTAVSTTGFTIQGRSEALGLIFSNANGLTVDVLIIEN